MAMFVSVIIPYYNQGKYLHSAVQSALLAYSGKLEVIIVNDGSTEGHANHYLQMARRLAPNVRVINKANGGLSSARNAGLDAATGEFIQFLDCDDVLVPGKIDHQIHHFQANSRLVVSVSGYYICNEWMGDFRNENHTMVGFPFRDKSFLFKWERGFTIPIHSGLFRKSVFEKLRFNENVYGKEDWIFWSTLAGLYPGQLGYCPINGAIYRLHEQGMTRGLDKMGEAWFQATQILSELYTEQYPDFISSSNKWHQKFYKGARLSNEAKLRLLKDRSETLQDKNSKKEGDRKDCALLFESGSWDNKPILSFIVPVFNHEEYLDQCLSSIFNQKGREKIEVIVVDDRSTDDGVIDVLKGVETQGVPYRVYQGLQNYGISITQNLAAEFAEGRYLAFIDCDDFLSPNAVVEVLSKIDEGQADYLFSDRNHVDENGKFIECARYGGYDWIKPSGSIEDDLLLGMIASHLKVIRRASYLAIGGSNPEYSGIQDWELALRMIGKGKFCYIAEPLYNHRIHSGSVTRSGAVAQFWMTNLLRRIYHDRFSGGEVGVVIDIDNLSKKNIKYISEKFRDGIRFIYRSPDGDVCGEQINLLREFNSFFDRIYLDEKASSALCGYLWSREILRVV